MAVVVLSSAPNHLGRNRLGETLAAVARQVYVPAQVLLVERPGPTDSESEGNSDSEVWAGFDPPSTLAPIDRLGSVNEVLGRLDESIGFVWLIHGDTRPRPDALLALLREMRRHDASVAGSKVLIEGSEDRLDSVGEATDVFGEPYSGLDPEELDLEQYDVVREVALVSPISLLVRGDLFKGLRGLDPSLPLDAAGLDLSQRARLAGGRVIVVPSSEVFHPEDCPDHKPGWRQQAGRQRAMLIAYRPITLAWVVPVGFMASLADGIGQLVLGRVRPLVASVAGWVWNIGKIGSTMSARRALNRVRQSGDEELFRFQVAGSVKLRNTLSELGERFSRAIDEDDAESLTGRTVHAWSKPTAILVAVSGLGVVIATRQIWFAGTPATGFSLPPADNLGALVASYGGGWQASGLGSPAATPPVAGLAALVSLLTGGRPEIAATVLTIAAVVAGLAGTIRLARRAGASSSAGHVAGWVYIGGAAASTLFGAGQWPLLLAAGPLPWALDSILATNPRPESGSGRDIRRQIGRYARGGLAAGLVAVAYPPALAMIPIAALLWALFTGRRIAAINGSIVTLIGIGLVAPFVASGNLWPLLTAAPLPQVAPVWLWPVSVAAAVAIGALWVSRTRLGPLGFGAAMALGGWLLARWPDVLPGIGMVGWLAASVGAAFLTALVVEVAEGPTWRRLVAFAALALFVVPSVITALGGRAGLPADQWSNRLGFVATLAEGDSSTRVLLIGPAAELPGASRALGSFSYRLIDDSDATLEQAYLPNFQPGDVALEKVVIDHLVRGVDLRPGAALAQFGIGWVVVLPGIDLDTTALARQVDLALTPVDPELTVFENLASGSRAVAKVGSNWQWNGQSYRGDPTGGRVRLADNASPRWGPDWAGEDWANSVSGQEGAAVFRADSKSRVAGFGSALLLVVLLVLAGWGRAGSGLKDPVGPGRQAVIPGPDAGLPSEETSNRGEANEVVTAI